MQKHTNWLPIIVIGGGLIIFSLFIYILIGGVDKFGDAVSELEQCNSFLQVKVIWNKYEPTFGLDTDWKDKVLEKLKPMTNLSEPEQNEARKWLNIKTALNLVIVPDLSYRIKEDHQVQTDKELIHHLWRCFGQKINQDIQSIQGDDFNLKDRLTVTVTPDVQEKMANNLPELSVDISTYGKLAINKLREHESLFIKDIDDIYNTAWQKTEGADYVQFVVDKLPIWKQPSTWYNPIDNVLVFITDGYLILTKNNELNGEGWYTGTPKQWVQARSLVDANIPISEAVNRANISISKGRGIDLSGWRVLMLEINDTDLSTYGKPGDAKVLRQIWYNWLVTGKCSVNFDEFCYAHNPVTQITKQEISKFFNIPYTTDNPVTTIRENSHQINEVVNKQSEVLLTQVLSQIKKENFIEAKYLLRQATKNQSPAELLKIKQAREIHQMCLNSGKTMALLIDKNKDYTLMDIPIQYLEIAQILNPSDKLQPIIDECRAKYQQATTK